MYLITGDVHRDQRLGELMYVVDKYNMDLNDGIIVLGDLGANLGLGEEDKRYKEKLNSIGTRVITINGNHDQKPIHVTGMKEKMEFGDIVDFEPEFPNITYLRDGYIYHIGSKSVFVMGGAYSIDKLYRIKKGFPWFEDEQPNEQDIQQANKSLDLVNDKVDFVLTHTCPNKYIPQEAFLANVKQSQVDKSTEYMLDKYEEQIEYKKWFCGHYHINKNIINKDKAIYFLFDGYYPFE